MKSSDNNDKDYSNNDYIDSDVLIDISNDNDDRYYNNGDNTLLLDDDTDTGRYNTHDKISNRINSAINDSMIILINTSAKRAT